jgi:hypothetical protein
LATVERGEKKKPLKLGPKKGEERKNQGCDLCSLQSHGSEAFFSLLFSEFFLPLPGGCLLVQRSIFPHFGELFRPVVSCHRPEEETEIPSQGRGENGCSFLFFLMHR